MKQLAKGLVRKTGLRRSHVASARMCCERNVLATVRLATVRLGNSGRQRARTGGRILCFHSIGQPLWGVNDVSPSQFRRQIELALAAGYRIVPAAEIARTGGGPRDLAITFDDGLKSVLTTAAPILAEYNAPWSLFVVSDWADGKHAWDADVMLDWREIERLAGAGVDIGSHSVTHPNFGLLDSSQVTGEIEQSRHTIAARTGILPMTFAIPFGQSGNWSPLAAAAARDAGYTTVYAQAEETRPAATVPRTFVTSWDNDRVFRAALAGAFDRWEEWV